MKFIGIDPGKRGAIVAIDDRTLNVQKWVIPLDDKNIDIGELCGLIVQNIEPEDIVGLEEIHSIYGTSKGTMFTMGRVWGNIEGALTCNNVPFEYVKPKDWQKAIWIPELIIKKESKTGTRLVNDTKQTSLNTAKKLYPHLDLRYGDNEEVTRRIKFHDGIIDALLIAEYVRRKYKYGII